jgi:tRNA (cytidine/uridine-2'-O-)-methyltransferase
MCRRDSWKVLEIALYQPDIAPNAGTIARFCACMGLPLTIIEPAGFAWTDSTFRRAALDYLGEVDIRRSLSWETFREGTGGRRIVLLTTRAETNYLDFRFCQGDILLAGRESAGVPEHVHQAADARIGIAMQPGFRSLNVALATAIVASEGLRQLRL